MSKLYKIIKKLRHLIFYFQMHSSAMSWIGERIACNVKLE